MPLLLLFHIFQSCDTALQLLRFDRFKNEVTHERTGYRLSNLFQVALLTDHDHLAVCKRRLSHRLKHTLAAIRLLGNIHERVHLHTVDPCHLVRQLLIRGNRLNPHRCIIRKFNHTGHIARFGQHKHFFVPDLIILDISVFRISCLAGVLGNVKCFIRLGI